MRQLTKFVYLSLFFIFNTANAIELSPMVLTIDAKNGPFSASSIITNTLNRDFAFDVEVYKINFLADGHFLELQEDPPFFIFPPAAFLKKGQSQKVQIQWLANIPPENDESYMVTLVEQDLATDLSANSVKMLFNFNLVVHLENPTLNANLLLRKSWIEKNEIVALIENMGKGNARLSNYEIAFSKKDELTESSSFITLYKKQQLKRLGIEVFLAPGTISKVRIPLPSSLTESRQGLPYNLRLVP
ncbi:hypothetical protein [Pseudoalteromonas sp. KAN5]|uniref:hypothetical protein n=1 Tax=Pseudoalteromonas sp. KAN5 TaxID=2916633 RepID=UPI001FCB4E41|nr:hypothetical protein [Pseudoalteromonas sp. KAN5]BDF94929.1 hypothetical protein KAN5_17670 [Pseudoalteromonas sp. KAN5]